MPACPNGARPKPGYTGTNLVLDASKTILSDVVGAVTGLWGELAVQPLLGRVNTDNLCALNLVDPGPPTNDDLVALSAMLAPFGSMQTATNVPTWFFNQVQYQAFVDACECIQPGETIPPRQIVSKPPWAEPWPTDPNKQPQIDRIERSLSTSNDALTTIYNGVQLGVTDLRDMAFSWRPSQVVPSGQASFTMSGEGEFALWPDGPGDADYVQDVLGIQVNLTAIPPTVKRRGVTFQRLYGVGSIEWNVSAIGGSDQVLVQRDALHYESQFIVAPQRVQNYRVRWRLQPGVQAVGYQAFRQPHQAVWHPFNPSDQAYQPFDSWSPPSGWTDHPFYPQPAASSKVFALGGVP